MNEEMRKTMRTEIRSIYLLMNVYDVDTGTKSHSFHRHDSLFVTIAAETLIDMYFYRSSSIHDMK